MDRDSKERCEVCGELGEDHQVVVTPLDGFLYFCKEHELNADGAEEAN